MYDNVQWTAVGIVFVVAYFVHWTNGCPDYNNDRKTKVVATIICHTRKTRQWQRFVEMRVKFDFNNSVY